MEWTGEEYMIGSCKQREKFKVCAMSSWQLWRPAKISVLFLLFGYFVSKIFDSSVKLQEREIGVSFERIREELVEDSALCYFESLAEAI